MSVQAQMLDPTYIDPELDKAGQIHLLCDALLSSGPPFKGLDTSTDIPALRAHLLEMKRNLNNANTAAEEGTVAEDDLQIPTRDQTQITLRIYRSKSAQSGGAPILVMYHGGGFCLGGLDNETLNCRRWVERFGGVAVNVDYRLAPEHAFPTAVHDAYDALKWVATNFDGMGGDPAKGFVIGGISAGGSLAAVISHLYRDEKVSPPLTGIYLSLPILVSPEAVPDKFKHQYLSREQNKNAPILNKEAIALFKACYKEDPVSPLASPLIFPTGHKNLPPTYFQICGMDPLRDDSFIYERILREECAVKTRVDLYPGLPHGFWSWFPEATFSKKQLEDSMEGMAWLLESK